MAYRAATPDVPGPLRVHSATWVAIALGVTAVALGLAGLWAVISFGLFAAPPTLTLIPVFAAAFDGVATVMTVRRARRLSRAPRRHALALALAILALALAALGAFAWAQITRHPPEPIHIETGPFPPINRC